MASGLFGIDINALESAIDQLQLRAEGDQLQVRAVLTSAQVRALLNAIGATLPSGSLIVAPRTIIVGLLVGLFTTMISSLIPAVKASRVKPLAALRDVSVDKAGTDQV